MLTELKRGVAFTIVTMLLFGGLYHGVVWAVGRAFTEQAEGGLIRRANGTVTGARLIAQAFTGPAYFHPRPSAVDFNAASAGGSNFGPSNPDQLKAVRERLDTILTTESTRPSHVPSEMVTASAAGLDPHIPPAAADLQASRVAAARGVSVDLVRALARQHTEPPTFGLLGRARINVLELNLALDGAFGPSQAGSR